MGKLDKQFWNPEPGTAPRPMPRRRKGKKNKRVKAKPAYVPQWKLDLIAKKRELSAWCKAHKTDQTILDRERPFWAT